MVNNLPDEYFELHSLNVTYYRGMKFEVLKTLEMLGGLPGFEVYYQRFGGTYYFHPHRRENLKFLIWVGQLLQMWMTTSASKMEAVYSSEMLVIPTKLSSQARRPQSKW
jgi:hypothetical protein